MRILRITCCFLVFEIFAGFQGAVPQTHAGAASNGPQPSFYAPVDEVSLTFHATGAQGLPATDLKLNDLTIYDDYKAPGRILVFETLKDTPTRAGILLDASESMQKWVARDQAIARQYAERLLRPQTDHAFIEEFGYVSHIIQPWTGDARALVIGLGEATAGGTSQLGGTALFDTIYSACLYQFGRSKRPDSGNFIVLFTDGEDNASHVDLRSAVDMCQAADTAIYAFRPRLAESGSSGPRNLSQLSSETGGRTFELDDTEAEVNRDLDIIDSDLRDRYWLVYRPVELKHNGSFHTIYVGASDPARDLTIDVRSEYYAPAH
ncbi:MAG: VWA domain-containing protein [Terracidiphilus sp.]